MFGTSAEHCIPTPAQLANAALIARLDELRVGVARAAAELPLLAPLIASRHRPLLFP